MKKYFISIFIILTLFSCEDILDKKPLDKFSEESVWSDVNLAKAFINSITNEVLWPYYAQSTDDWTDNVMLSEFGLASNSFCANYGATVKQGLVTPQTDMGWNIYGTVRHCNRAIEQLADNKSINILSRDRMLAEAHLLRAMCYFQAVRKFGGVMLVDRILTPNDNFKIPRASEEECYNFIIKDIETAAKILPEKVNQGELSKYAAYAFLSRVALEAGMYDRVIESCSKVEEGGFILDTYYNISKEYNTILTSPEIILSFAREKTHNTSGATPHQRILPGINNSTLAPERKPRFNGDGYSGWLQIYPPQELVDDYLFNENGKAVQKKGVDFKGLPSYKMWQNRDARFDISIVRDSSSWYTDIITTRANGNAIHGAWPEVPSQQSASGYYFNKFVFEKEPIGCATPMNYAVPLLRLGEVYLNKAEAYYRKGDLSKAIEYTNKTRVKHGKLPPIELSTSKEEFYKLYKIERRVELLFEDDRFWTLRRLAKADNATSVPELEGLQHCMVIDENGMVSNVVPMSHIVQYMHFELPKMFYFPIPDGEILNNSNLEQNPYW